VADQVGVGEAAGDRRASRVTASLADLLSEPRSLDVLRELSQRLPDTER